MNRAETMESRAGAGRPQPSSLSPAQRAIWFLDKAGSAGAYNIARACRLEGPLDVGILEAAHQSVVGRHEILRTRIVEDNGIPVAVIDDPYPIDFELLEMEETAVRSYLAAEATRPFDLSTDSMWRVRAIRLSNDDHILLDVVHHIAADGWSLPRVRSETGQFYTSGLIGEAPDLSPPVQYREVFAARSSDGTVTEPRLAYWARTLNRAAEAIPLHSDRPRNPTRSSSGFWVKAMVPGLSGDDLDRLAGELDATPSMIGLSAFACCLARYSRSNDVVIGIPVTGRSDPLDQEVIGPFFNSLPIRLRVEPEMSFRDLVTHTRTQVLDALHHEVPLDEIVRSIDPPRIPGQTPIFQVMFQHRDPSFREGYGLPGITEHPVDLAGKTAKFDLLLEVGARDGGVEMSLNLSSDLFDRSTGESLVEGIAQFSGQAYATPDGPIGGASMTSLSQRGWLMESLTGDDSPMPRIESLAGYYESQVSGKESSLAIHDGRPITHADLLDASHRIETKLTSAGVTPGSVVALLLDRSAAMVASMIATNRLGAVYVPIDPGYPTDRIRTIVEISGAAVSVSPAEGNDWSDVNVEPVDEPRRAHDFPPDAVYIMFTSGSTGAPKGVVVDQNAILRLVCHPDYVTIDEGDVIAHLSNVAFDASTFEIWAPLLNGGSMAVMDSETVLSPEALEAELAERAVTTVFVTTALFNLIARQRPETFAGVRNVLFGGERCDPSAVQKIIATAPPERLVHVYGPTETTTFASWYQVPLDGSAPDPVPIGRPISNTRLYVLDGWGQPLPPGLVGELNIGGPGVAVGYAGDPSETQARFQPDPFSDDPWGRMYRTGDLVRVRDDGNIDFVGRADRQVKLRGFRIEPDEIERSLLSHPSVNEAVVRLIEDDDPKLVAWVTTEVTTNEEPIAVDDLREHVGSKLPRFMVPTIAIVAQIPIGATGKFDTSQLPLKTPHARGAPPANETEASVIELFEQVLGVDDVGRSDDFFDLGGHSIRAVELVSLVEKRFGVRLGVMEMWEGPTPSEIAARVESGNLGALEQRLVTLAEGPGDPLFIFHHPSGTVQGYSDLARALPVGLRVVGVNASGVDGTVHPATNLVEMADEYASLLASAHPHGEFQLVGHSLGGLLAWETARQLMKAGRSVEFLGLIDTQLPRGSVASSSADLAESLRTSVYGSYRTLRRLAGDLKWGSRRLWLKTRRRPIPADLARTNLVRASSKAFDSYRARRLDSDVSYFLAEGTAASGGGKIQQEWFDLCDSMEVIRVPGMHSGPNSILYPPNVSTLAEEMARRATITEKATTE